MKKEFIQLRLTLTRLDWCRVNLLLSAGVLYRHGKDEPKELDELRRLRDLIDVRLTERGL